MSDPLVLEVPSMTCGHCTMTIRKALGGPGHAQVEVQMKAKEVRVAAESADLPGILAALEAEEYPAFVR
jgi:copper chaperone CopZ